LFLETVFVCVSIMAWHRFKTVSSSFIVLLTKRNGIAEIYELQDRVRRCKEGARQITTKDRNLPAKEHSDELPVQQPHM